MGVPMRDSDLYRVTYVTSGLRRRVRTVTSEDLEYLRGAWHTGIRVTSYRKANEAETRRGAYFGPFNQ